MLADNYAALAHLVDYPSDKTSLLESCQTISRFMQIKGLDLTGLTAFAAFASNQPLAALQEEYVATFDFNPATAPYLGHHLFGDNPKKGGYMIMLKQEFKQANYCPAGVELPDHLSVVLGFLAHLARHPEGELRQQFINASVLPGLERMEAAFAEQKETPLKTLITTARLLCAEDGKEVLPC